MLIAKLTRRVRMNWCGLTFTAIFTLELTGAVGVTAIHENDKGFIRQALEGSESIFASSPVAGNTRSGVTKSDRNRHRRVTLSHFRSPRVTAMRAKHSQSRTVVDNGADYRPMKRDRTDGRAVRTTEKR
jgi:hypothetical protein